MLRARSWMLLGPAFVAAIAYVDPGNVAANLSGGARYGYLLVWVLVVANLMAGIVQYQSARLGIVSGKTLPSLLGEHLRPLPRRAFWAQAELVAARCMDARVGPGSELVEIMVKKSGATPAATRPAPEVELSAETERAFAWLRSQCPLNPDLEKHLVGYAKLTGMK